MECKKLEKVKGSFVMTQNPDKSYYGEKYLICGRKDKEQFKFLIEIDLKSFINLYSIKGNVKKVELCLYLSDIKIDDYINNYMINLGINVEKLYISNVTCNNAPKCMQKNCMYIMDRRYINNYVNLDITKVVEGWIDGTVENNGISFIGINEDGYVIFDSNNNDNKPFIKVWYEKEVEVKTDKLNEDKAVEDKTDSKEIEKKCYGYFINSSGNYLKLRKYNVIMWDNQINNLGLKLDKNKSSIIVESKGIYQVDYGINIRSNNFTYMMISIKGVPIQYSMIQIGRQENMVSGNVIIEISHDNTPISLLTKKTDMILANIGILSYMRIIKL